MPLHPSLLFIAHYLQSLWLHRDFVIPMRSPAESLVRENNFPNQPKIQTGKDAERRYLRSHAGAWERDTF